MARWSWRDKSIAFAVETAYGTENTTGAEFLTTAFPAEVGVPSHVRELEEFEASTAQVGAFEPPAPGSKHGGSFSVRMPIRTLKTGYTAATDQPGVTDDVVSHEILLWANALGSDASSGNTTENFRKGLHLHDEPHYDASGTRAAGSTTVVKLPTGEGTKWKPGSFVAANTNVSDTATQVGFVESIGTDDATLFEASQTAAAEGDKVYNTATAYLSGEEPQSLTFRIVGDATQFALIYMGCIATGWTLEATPGKTPMLEITYDYTDRKWDTTAGSLLSKDAFERLPPALGGSGAYFTLNGLEKCIADLTISQANTIAYIPCHSGAQGYTDLVVTDRALSASFAIVHGSGDTVTGDEHDYEYKLTQGTTLSLGLYIGNTIGKILGILCPAWHVTEQPQPELIDGLMYHRVSVRPSEYTGDGDGTVDAVQNSIFRVGIA